MIRSAHEKRGGRTAGRGHAGDPRLDAKGRGYAVIGLRDPVEVLSGATASNLGIVHEVIERRRVSVLGDVAPLAGVGDAWGRGKVTRGERGVAVGTPSTPNATLFKAVGRRRPNDGTMMLLRWNLEKAYAKYLASEDLADMDPLAHELAEAAFSSLTRGRLALRVNGSGVLLDMSVARPQPGR